MLDLTSGTRGSTLVNGSIPICNVASSTACEPVRSRSARSARSTRIRVAHADARVERGWCHATTVMRCDLPRASLSYAKSACGSGHRGMSGDQHTGQVMLTFDKQPDGSFQSLCELSIAYVFVFCLTVCTARLPPMHSR